MDLCDPKLVHQEPPLFWGFWGQCFNDYRCLAVVQRDGSGRDPRVVEDAQLGFQLKFDQACC